MAEIYRAPGIRSRYFHVSNELARNPELSPRAARVYLFIASHVDGWKITTSSVAKMINMSEGTVKAAMRDLEALGYVERERQQDEQGRFISMRYVVHEESILEPTGQNLSNGTEQAVSSDEPRVKKRPVEKPTSGKSDPLKKTIKRSKKTKVKEDHNDRPTGDQASPTISDEFEDWWRHVPRKVAKKKARGLYERARKSGVSAGVLLRALERDRASWAQEGRALAHIPHPSTWLGQERWADEPDDWSPVPSQAPRPQNFMDALRASRQAEGQADVAALPEAARGELPW